MAESTDFIGKNWNEVWGVPYVGDVWPPYPYIGDAPYPYIGDYPPNTIPTVTRPDTKPFDFTDIFLDRQASREQIEKELLQKIAKELKAFFDTTSYDWENQLIDWAAEIIEKYYVEPEE